MYLIFITMLQSALNEHEYYLMACLTAETVKMIMMDLGLGWLTLCFNLNFIVLAPWE